MGVTTFTPQNAIRNAHKIFLERYKGAEFCIAAGSIVRGEGPAHSDLDLVVVFPSLPFAFRESFTFEGMPVEAFVHDHETLQAFIDEDYGDGEASIMDMIAHGRILPEESDTPRKLQEYAAGLLNKGPDPLSAEKERNLRYFISDLIDDLKGDRPDTEKRAILYKLYPKMGELALRKQGRFSSTGKHLARSLKNTCPEVFDVLEGLMQAAHNGRLDDGHIRQLENALDRLGGLLFDGYRMDAPNDKRSKPQWKDSGAGIKDPATEPPLTIRETMDTECLHEIEAGLNAHNQKITGSTRIPVHFVLTSPGKTMGGMKAGYVGPCFFISWLYVAPDARNLGWGKKLMTVAEIKAKKLGCNKIFVDTMSFQAPEFYESLGFKVCARIANFYEGHDRIFFQKSL